MNKKIFEINVFIISLLFLGLGLYLFFNPLSFWDNTNFRRGVTDYYMYVLCAPIIAIAFSLIGILLKNRKVRKAFSVISLLEIIFTTAFFLFFMFSV